MLGVEVMTNDLLFLSHFDNQCPAAACDDAHCVKPALSTVSHVNSVYGVRHGAAAGIGTASSRIPASSVVSTPAPREVSTDLLSHLPSVVVRGARIGVVGSIFSHM